MYMVKILAHRYYSVIKLNKISEAWEDFKYSQYNNTTYLTVVARLIRDIEMAVSLVGTLMSWDTRVRICTIV